MLVMVAGYSRWITARMLPSRSAADLIAGHWRLSTELGAVLRALVSDNEGAVGSWRSGGPQLTDEFAAFAVPGPITQTHPQATEPTPSRALTPMSEQTPGP